MSDMFITNTQFFYLLALDHFKQMCTLKKSLGRSSASITK